MKTKFVLLFIVAMLCAAGAVTYLNMAAKPISAAETEMAQSDMPAPDVGVLTLGYTRVANTERLPGRTHAYRLAEVRPQVTGIVLARRFEEGQTVEQGQTLYQIDPAMYEVAVSQAEAALMTARANAELAGLREERLRSLRDSAAVSQQDYDDIKVALAQSEAAVQSAEAALRSAQLNLEYTRVRSPISGQISQSLVSEGALVTANQAQALAVITQLDPIYVDVMQSSAEHMRMREQLAAEGEIAVDLELTTDTGYAHPGVLQFSSVYVSETTGSVQLRALFPNPEKQLLPGMFVHASLRLGEEVGLLVPQQAAQRSNDGDMTVWRLGADNTVSQVPVMVERAVGNQWLLREGLSPGDRIVVDGFQRLSPGMDVNPVTVEGQRNVSSSFSND